MTLEFESATFTGQCVYPTYVAGAEREDHLRGARDESIRVEEWNTVPVVALG
jgi:hypothetical protein